MTSSLKVGSNVQTNHMCRFAEALRVGIAILGSLPHGMVAGTARQGEPVNSPRHAGYGTAATTLLPHVDGWSHHWQIRLGRGQAEPDRANTASDDEISRGTCRAIVRTAAAGVRR